MGAQESTIACAMCGKRYRIAGYKRAAQPEWVEISGREDRLKRRVPPHKCPTTTRDPTFAPAVRSFYDQIGHLGLQKLKPAELAIGGHSFGVMSFAWRQPWGFSISCNNEHPRLDIFEKFVARKKPIICRMRFVDISIEFRCYLKAMSFDEQSIRLSFAGTGVISEKRER